MTPLLLRVVLVVCVLSVWVNSALARLSTRQDVQDNCASKTNITFSTTDKVLVNGMPMNIKGVNWFGFETGIYCVEGLNERPLDDILDMISAQGFNTLRIPVSADLILNMQSRYPTNIDYNANPSLNGLTSIQVLDRVFEGASARGITILFDMHTFDPVQVGSMPPLWYSSTCLWNSSLEGDNVQMGRCIDVFPACIPNKEGNCIFYTEQVFIDVWVTLISRYSSYWNFLGADLLNEPHEPAIWGSGGIVSQYPTDWASAVERIAPIIMQRVPSFNGLFLVEGIANYRTNPYCQNTTLLYEDEDHWWGGNYEPVRCRPLTVGDNSRLAFIPHQYGPSVYVQANFQDPSFPTNMPDIWNVHFGSVRDITGKAMIIGEWGGAMDGGMSEVWLNAMADYLIAKDLRDNIFWALNPNRDSDTPGVLLDWYTFESAKLTLLARVQPTPTSFTISSDNVCFTNDAIPTSTPSPDNQHSSAAHLRATVLCVVGLLFILFI